MRRWIVLLYDELDTFGQSVARTLVRLLLYGVVLGVVFAMALCLMRFSETHSF